MEPVKTQDRCTLGHIDFPRLLLLSPELATFPKFEQSSLRNLTYYQDELQALEASIVACEAEDINDVKKGDVACELETRGRNGNWSLFNQAGATDAKTGHRLALVMRMRQLTKEYQQALLSHAQVMQLPPPSEQIFELLKQWTERYEPFLGAGSQMFASRDDLACLDKVRPERDLLSRAAQYTFGCCFRERKQFPGRPDIKFYSELAIKRMTTIIGVFLAIFLLFGATVVLTFATGVSKVEQMAIIGAFTATFTILVGIFTNAKRAELFVAVATYSAVLVVFAQVTNAGGTTAPAAAITSPSGG
ncbi:Hypothetical protein D9617_10g074790 [Elsinoe fawcettii]|nr:Hypothetical protein D9617_10g074790 [Elsinoe fawcettii]